MSEDLCLRDAMIEDADILFSWANDKLTRENSFSKEPIEWDTHIKWMINKINDLNCKMYILCNKDIPVGTIRYEVDNNIATISFTISPSERRKSYGKKIIELICKKINEQTDGVEYIEGLVYNNNVASQKCFECNGFIKIAYGEYVVFRKSV